MKNDDFGDRMKGYEQPSTNRYAMKGLPLMARLDGKSFHTFTKGLQRPFDPALSQMMIVTMAALVEEFQCTVGYTQSDEITLMWYIEADSPNDYPYVGRFQKMESLMAAFATARFNRMLPTQLPSKADKMPLFDCRAFQVPSKIEAMNNFLWRQQDATKNAISMAAQSMFSHKSLQSMTGPQMQERMWAENNVNFNDYPPHFKRGVFARREPVIRMMTDEECARIPTQFQTDDRMVTRTETKIHDFWLSKITNKIDVLFDRGEPLTQTVI